MDDSSEFCLGSVSFLGIPIKPLVGARVAGWAIRSGIGGTAFRITGRRLLAEELVVILGRWGDACGAMSSHCYQVCFGEMADFIGVFEDFTVKGQCICGEFGIVGQVHRAGFRCGRGERCGMSKLQDIIGKIKAVVWLPIAIIGTMIWAIMGIRKKRN